ncbi:hypothetical protein [Mahella australiensis]|uniref:Uncharacterized protein n=1 Tax=Mahella australiensis (strain DSM 15567 / CIP 107919 / 50-1 BON) TaxID=697281 RepID=F3ZYI4_MAHA5|nr:hypothetical protein [Mahella australiensis]AEE96726.1 hypothetical protein Mahau_1537 [Mahella australiensis 50-1 BON]
MFWIIAIVAIVAIVAAIMYEYKTIKPKYSDEMIEKENEMDKGYDSIYSSKKRMA